MRIDNPWIAGRCAQAQVPPNRLPTLLQEQYGQLGEDLILEGVLKSYFARAGLDQARVRYVEIGANHPIQTSNTFLFASKWKGCGLLVEANPQLIHELERVRPGDRVLNLAVVPPGYPKEVRINLASNSELSSLDAGHITSFGAIGQLAGEALVPSVTLDQLLEVHFPDGLHLLSIDIEGLDLEVLAQSRFSRRPTFVVAEPSRHYHADAEANFGRVMTSKGYCEVARTDYNLIYADASQVQMVQAPACNATERPNHLVARKVRTFDVFDTLIARRCIHPHQIHVQAEIRSGIQGFALARVQAEAAVARTEYGMTDIYRQLARTLGWDEALSAKMMALELRLELDNVIPIAQGLAQLDNESVLITDMYLPEEAIRQMLRKVGVNLHLPMIRSSAGKHSGRVWKALSERGWDCWHLGDNAVSDMANARRFGMKPVHLSVAAPTRLEATLYVEGFTELAQALAHLAVYPASRAQRADTATLRQLLGGHGGIAACQQLVVFIA
jgi:FkbM family methyltransferase